jgi:addiction module RelE/StbE family toxin
MKIEFTSSFLRSYKKIVSRRPDTAVSVLQKVVVFLQQPNSPSIGLHKLKGQLKDVWSFSVEKDLRIIVDLKDPEKILFVDIGSHDQVY